MKTTGPPTREGNKEPATKTAAAPPPPRTLSEDDWNFDKVPDDEIEVCCYWEYARESDFILTTYPESEHIQERIEPCDPRNIAAKRHFIIWQALKKVQSAVGQVAGLFYTLNSPFPQPWQSLTTECKRPLLEAASQSYEIPAFRWSSSYHVLALAADQIMFELQQLPKPPPMPTAPDLIKRLLARMELPSPADLLDMNAMDWDAMNWDAVEKFWWENKPRTERPSWPVAPGEERLLVEIDWGRFTNEQIIECFRKWVRVHRPKDVPRPTGKGHERGRNKTSDWRAALNRLGIMRALHYYSFADPRFPEPLKDCGEKTCYAARKKAEEKFRELFPFEQEKPIHWKTKGGKSR